MNLCYLSLGSNQKSPERQLRRAINAIGDLPRTIITQKSRFYWTKAWGMSAQQNFCNSVLEIRTTLPPMTLLNFCQLIENNQGRIRRIPWGPRTLDIDILLYSDRTINTKRLIIPHPFMTTRDFVLTPLLEINPHIVLPN